MTFGDLAVGDMLYAKVYWMLVLETGPNPSGQPNRLRVLLLTQTGVITIAPMPSSRVSSWGWDRVFVSYPRGRHAP